MILNAVQAQAVSKAMAVMNSAYGVLVEIAFYDANKKIVVQHGGQTVFVTVLWTDEHGVQHFDCECHDDENSFLDAYDLK